MKVPFTTHAFTAGALAPSFHGRVDLDKYDLGVAQAENFFVDFRGGLTSRPGTKFLLDLEENTRLFEFKLRADQDSVVLLFGAERLRFFQTDGLLTSSGSPIEIETPYETNRLKDLKYHQTSLAAYLTHPEYPPHKLTFAPAANTWTFVPVDFDVRADFESAYPTLTAAQIATKKTAFQTAVNNNFGLSASFDGESGTDASIIYTLSVVDPAGVETLAATPSFKTDFANYSLVQGAMTFTWNAVPGAEFYRLYRSSVVSNGELDFAQPLGLIAETRGTSFVDDNVTPDYNFSPLRQYNPFADGAILEIEVTEGGADYAKSTTVTAGGSGSGFVGHPIIRGGEVVAVRIQAPGEGYAVGDPLAFSDTEGTGSSATAQITSVTPASGNNPRVFTRFQQHGMYAGTDNVPSGVWGSRRGLLDNHDKSDTVTAADAYFYAIDNTPVNPVENLIPIRDSLLIFHPLGVERLRAEEGRAVTATSAFIEQQAALGASSLSPIVVNNDVIFSLRQGTSILALIYTFYTNSFTPQDLSVLSSHYLVEGGKPTSFAWQEEPYKLLWTTLTSGELLSLTYLREQEIIGWTRHRTRGEFRQVLSVNCSDKICVYAVVLREFAGDFVWCLEQFQEIGQKNVEDHWGVDSGLSLASTYPFSTITYDREEGEITSVPGVFSSSNLGDYIRFNGGVVEITEVVSVAVVKVYEHIPPTDSLYIPGPDDWSMDTPVLSVSGLEHLEGETVSVLADGDAILGKVVTDGTITLDNPASRITVGLPFEALVETLPLFTPQAPTEGKRKRIVGTAIRLDKTRGLELGTSLNRMYEMKDRGYEDWAQVTQTRSDNSLILHAARWERDARLFARQRYPLPATILGLVTEAELGE